MTFKGIRIEWGPAIDRKVRIGLSCAQAADFADELRVLRVTEITLITSANARIEGEYLIRAALLGVS